MPALLAVEVADPMKYENNQIPFVLTNSTTGQRYGGIVQYSDDKCIKLQPSNTGSWALRVINQRCASLDDAELSNFLEKTKNSTFAFFKMEDKTGIHIYLIALAKGEEKNNDEINGTSTTTTINNNEKDNNSSKSSSSAAKTMILEILPDLEPIILPEKLDKKGEQQESKSSLSKSANTANPDNKNNYNSDDKDKRTSTYKTTTATTTIASKTLSYSSGISKGTIQQNLQQEQGEAQKMVETLQKSYQEKITDRSDPTTTATKTNLSISSL